MSKMQDRIAGKDIGDQAEGMIRDSDIKFQCRLLISSLSILQANGIIDTALMTELVQPIGEIVRLENKRLNKLATVPPSPKNTI